MRRSRGREKGEREEVEVSVGPRSLLPSSSSFLHKHRNDRAEAE